MLNTLNDHLVVIKKILNVLDPEQVPRSGNEYHKVVFKSLMMR